MSNDKKSFTEYYDKGKLEETLMKAATIVDELVPLDDANDETIIEEKTSLQSSNKEVKLVTEAVESFKDTLTESNNTLVESITKISESNNKYIETTVKQQQEMIAVLTSLVERIETLEEKINIEIPTPVVNVHMPKTVKKVHRDNKGHISHISEDFVEDDNNTSIDEEKQDK